MEVILVADPSHIELLHKVIGDQICRGKLKNTSKSATSVSGLCRAYTNQREFLIRYPAHGYLLNRA